MREKWMETMEAEERTALLERMVKNGLSTGDVRKEVRKQVMTRRCAKEDNTGELLMRNKLKDSRKEERTFRKEKSKIRRELELTLGNNNKFLRRVRRLKQVIVRARAKIRKKNKIRFERDIASKKNEDRKRM